MDRVYFCEFVEYVGGRAKAAELLGVTIGLIDHMKSGKRGISTATALKIEQKTQGKFSKSKLIWGDAA